MGSMDPGESDRLRRKRARIDELPCQHGDILCDEGWSSVSKRTCPALEPPEEEHQLSLLEDLYGLDNTQDCSLLESGFQEGLVSEMMKSLEKVIETEEISSLEPSLDGSSQLLYNSMSQRRQSNPQTFQSPVLNDGLGYSSISTDRDFVRVREGSDSSESEVDIKFLREASDDELGIPPSPEAERATGNFVGDATWLDVGYPELFDELNLQLITGVNDENSRQADGRQSWAGILDGFADLEVPICAEREYCEYSVF